MNDKLVKIVAESRTFAEIFRKMNKADSGTSYKILKRRLKQLNIDFSHIPQGIGANRGRCFWKQPPIQKSKLFIENSKHSRLTVRRYIIKYKLIEYKCEQCNLGPDWNHKSLTLVLDHINGKRNDHRLENLRFLCPNCNSQTNTFGSRNWTYISKHFDNELKCKCGNKILNCNKSGLCYICYAKSEGKQPSRIPKEELEKLIWIEPTITIAARLGVSDKAVSKWCKRYGISKPGPGYWSKKRTFVAPMV